MELLEPREVERPFHWRWLKGGAQLMLRFPIHFGTLIAILSFLDVTTAKYLQGYDLPRALYKWIGVAALPVLWTLVSAIARGVEYPAESWSSLRDYFQNRIWYRALLAGILLFLPGVCLSAVFQDFSDNEIVLSPGAILTVFGGQCIFWWFTFGICYFPLLIFAPELSGWRLYLMSNKAAALNSSSTFWILMAAISCAADLIEYFLSYGVSEAAGLIYSGLVGYVACKDIFLRKQLEESSLAKLQRSAEVVVAPVSSPETDRAYVLHR
jgi:hypothetical protein